MGLGWWHRATHLSSSQAEKVSHSQGVHEVEVWTVHGLEGLPFVTDRVGARFLTTVLTGVG